MAIVASPSPPSPSLRVLTLNVWGLAFFSKERVPRIRAIAHRLADPDQSPYDVVALQEIWCESTDWRFLRSAVSHVFPYSKFFLGGAFGSGLAILSRYPILRTQSRPYCLNGQPVLVNHGDWIAAKAAGCATIDVPELGELDVWVTHTIAAGGEDGPEVRRAHRVAQAYELSCHVRESAERGRHVISLGDFNSTPPSLCMDILRNVGNLTDSFLKAHPSLPWHATSLSGPRAEDPERCIAELGITCDSPLCTWTAGKKLDARALRGQGKRLDYIFYRGPEGRPCRLETRSSRVSWTEKVPGKPYSYSDHFGLETVFKVLDPAKAAAIDAAAASSGAGANAGQGTTSSASGGPTTTLKKAMTALSASMVGARETQRRCVLIFSGSITLALGLIALAATNVGGGAVAAICTLLAVVLGFTGTTALYSGLVWGEWEKRLTRTIIEAIELDLHTTRRRQALSSSSSSSSSSPAPGAQALDGSASGSANRMAPDTMPGSPGAEGEASATSSSGARLVSFDAERGAEGKLI